MTEIRAEAGMRGGFRVVGELVFDTVPGLLAQGRALFDDGAPGLEIDFSGVTRADSAGLALLIGWMRIAHRRHRNIVFRNVPEQMLAIARVSGIEAILPLAPPQ
jgi:phospholipid transport system transporter-binding protein